MYRVINGYTKAKMKETIRKHNNGTRSGKIEPTMLSDDKFQCLYLAPDGNRCAVGCFIPDDHKGLSLSGSADTLLCEYPDLADVLPLEEDGLLILQHIHDEVATQDMHERLCNWIDEFCKD